ncbi:hypothetical protein D3C78_1758990 [compost metagenome]
MRCARLACQAVFTVSPRVSLPWVVRLSHHGESALAAKRGSVASITRVESSVSKKSLPSSSCIVASARLNRNWLNSVALVESIG